MILKKSIASTEYYSWGENCKAWNLANLNGMIIKEEIMPPHTEEEYHAHEKADQFFYIISGVASFLINDKELKLVARECIQIPPLSFHQISNKENKDLQFLVISNPSTDNDRILRKK